MYHLLMGEMRLPFIDSDLLYRCAKFDYIDVLFVDNFYQGHWMW
jgi:hypothetical protein